ncbi:MAG: DUF364 domain-containing protein [Desulfobacterota bacterium]|nr:DUF364 domain-containing protein [Thermodesulfobacteriota bacterium]
MITDIIRNFIKEIYPEVRAKEVRIGLGYTGVLLEDGNAGVAYTFKQGLIEGCSVFCGDRPLAGKSSHELLDYIGSTRPIEAAVGIAAANALVNRLRGVGNEGDVLNILKIKKTDRIGMVGFFGPLVSLLKEMAQELLIFEQTTSLAEGLFPAEKAFDLLPSCDIAFITSTTLINGTLDSILNVSLNCREVVLLGASTILLPEVFKPFGITLLSGIIITDPTGILQIISEGGGMRFFKPYIKKLNIRVGLR